MKLENRPKGLEAIDKNDQAHVWIRLGTAIAGLVGMELAKTYFLTLSFGGVAFLSASLVRGSRSCNPAGDRTYGGNKTLVSSFLALATAGNFVYGIANGDLSGIGNESEIPAVTVSVDAPLTKIYKASGVNCPLDGNTITVKGDENILSLVNGNVARTCNFTPQ